jgi:hypothetical protein
MRAIAPVKGEIKIMGSFRFRMPGLSSRLIRLNVSKTGVSVTAGLPGAHLNYDLSGRRNRRLQATVGVPGTGLSYRQQLGWNADVHESKQRPVATNEPRRGLPLLFGCISAFCDGLFGGHAFKKIIAIWAFILAIGFLSVIGHKSKPITATPTPAATPIHAR